MDVWNIPFGIVVIMVVIIAILGVVILLWRLKTTRIHERLEELG